MENSYADTILDVIKGNALAAANRQVLITTGHARGV